jgi:septal ring factor EnvC (AmiA/AmiB activator)
LRATANEAATALGCKGRAVDTDFNRVPHRQLFRLNSIARSRLRELTGGAEGRLIAAIQIQYRMSTYAQLESAFKGLLAALDQLEAACERRRNADAERSNLEEELAVLQDDRTRLALELDDAKARSKSLELANGEVARRLAKASSNIRTILAQAAALDP